MLKPESEKLISSKGRLADQLAERLIAKIKTLSPGTKLPPEIQLAADFQVSRTVVREAISQLKAIGILRSQQGAGNFVAPPSQTTLSFRDLDGYNPLDIVKFMEIRSGLDAAAARLAASRRTKAQLAEMRELCRRTMQASNVQEAAESDISFHLAVVEATANEHFVSVFRFLNAQIEEGIMFTRRLISGSSAMESDVRDEHQAILAAIEGENPELAAQKALEHIINSQNRLKLSFSHLAKSMDRR
ncbi:MAG: FadR/GntR family transcriptional regulator [Opitutaceae bacterium]|nr:FadR/GntR family transcriptional regulator [Opitutaceae bacterium]